MPTSEQIDTLRSFSRYTGPFRMTATSGYPDRDDGRSASSLATIQWVMLCIESMRRPRLMTYGCPDTGRWWADGYERQRREEMTDPWKESVAVFKAEQRIRLGIPKPHDAERVAGWTPEVGSMVWGKHRAAL